ncbi:hypothetical protein JMJ77_0014527, partial [Colletotrichum scovillei]
PGNVCRSQLISSHCLSFLSKRQTVFHCSTKPHSILRQERIENMTKSRPIPTTELLRLQHPRDQI